jgi:hypothetical protein
MPLQNPITEAQIPPPIARDAEFAAADAAHLKETHPHPQYLRVLQSFDFVVQPVSLAANTWQSVGNDLSVGQLGVGTTWIVNLYWQLDASPFTQYCGAALLGCIYWQADLLTNEGIYVPVPTEAHNEVDFSCRLRFGRGNGGRKLEIKPDRSINISAPGFFKASGIRIQ